jgi:hypothetical protein
MDAEHTPGGDKPGVRHEESDVNIRPILLFGLVMVIAGVLINLLISLLFSLFAAREAVRLPRQYPLAASEENRLPPEPRLQTNPREDMRNLRAAEDAVLGTYGWVDKNAGIVRIPIAEAMKLTVERGLPARPAAPGAASTAPAAATMSFGDANSGRKQGR